MTEPTCSCGLWICRECRPENFDPDHILNKVDVDAKLAELERVARRGTNPEIGEPDDGS